MSKTYIVGDIHGHLKALERCLAKVNFDNEKDMLISVGDLCDRGPDSYGVVERLMKIKNLVVVHGNHDLWLLDYFNGKHPGSMWMQQGGAETLDSYDIGNWKNKQVHIDFYKSMLPYYVKDNCLFVHGGINRNIPVKEQNGYDLAWNRRFPDEMMSCTGEQKLSNADGFDTIIIGHTPTLYWMEDVPGVGKRYITKPIFRGGAINIDTGCGKGGPLTIMDFDTKQYWQTDESYK